MRALTIRLRQPGSALVAEVPEPRPDPEQYLVEVVEVGVCGTDGDIAGGEYGGAPAGCGFLILGHEALVLGYRLVSGSVSAHRVDFERGVRDLALLQQRYPGMLPRFFTARVPLADTAAALDVKRGEALKTVVEVARGS